PCATPGCSSRSAAPTCPCAPRSSGCSPGWCATAARAGPATRTHAAAACSSRPWATRRRSRSPPTGPPSARRASRRAWAPAPGSRAAATGREQGRRASMSGPAASGPITVMIAEDQTMMGSALASLLELEEDLRVVALVARGDEVIDAVTAHRPDVLLLDIELPGRSGLDLIADVLAVSPTTEVVVVTTFGRTGYLRRAMDAGARGFLVKDRPITALAAAIRRAAAGESVIDPDLAARALTAGPNPLTGRERDVLAAAEGGAPIAEIARTLHLSQSTVRNYLSSAIGKTSA